MVNFIRGKACITLIVILFSASSFSQNITGGQVVPVVVHIISQNPGAVTDQQIADAIANLNDAFAHTGPYAVAPGVNTGIHFCLAKVDPDGGNSTGITRTQSVLGDFDSDIENEKLKGLNFWDNKEYCNIWYVEGVKNEYMANFSCGSWSRQNDIGYSAYDESTDSLDGIVTATFGPELARLMGAYLGLKNTFVRGSCANNNCDTDGDGVCDTPPASAPGAACATVQNSCSSDTLSGFKTDMPDLNSNFMSLAGDCTNSFTAGQAAKMRSNLNSVRSSLLDQNKCNVPCAENIVAGFTRDNWLPKAGDLIHFASTSTGGTHYQWSVNGTIAGTNSPTYSMKFTTAGKYKVTLKVYNANIHCFASYSDFVIVNCGVMARFTPDVREIASKESILLDSILFTNRSVNGTSWQWWMNNNAGMDPEIVSTTKDFNGSYKTPGNYSIWLVAKNGACTDTTKKFSFPVFDPTIDGSVNLNDVQCYQETKIIVKMSVCNNGYATAPAGVPITFYNSDPGTGEARKLSTVFYTPDPIAGKCCHAFTTIIDVDTAGLNQLYAVFNDNGSTSPLKLPNTTFTELNYTNNTSSKSDFQFHVTAIPSDTTLQPGDTLRLNEAAGPGIVSSYVWSTAEDLDCTECANPYFTAANKVYNSTKKVIATSSYGCADSDLAILHIPPADDFQVKIDKLDCAGTDSLHAAFTICNNFKRGDIPAGLKVSFYDADPTEANANLLGPVFSTNIATRDKCASYAWFFKRSATGQVFAIVNENMQPDTALTTPLHQEAAYENNKDTFSVTPFEVTIHPADTSISRLSGVRLIPQTSGGDASAYQWEPAEYLSCTDCSSPVATPDKNVEYHLTVQNEYACAATGTSYLKVFSGGSVNIPNGFTPNNDGHNDVFYILGGKDVKMIEDISIFNRWGQKIFQVSDVSPNDPRFGWNGLLNGKPADTGTYAYFAVIAFADGSTHTFKGTITLIR